MDSCITDPPYELDFMGKKWDKSGIAFDMVFWRQVYGKLKPGAFLLAFGGTRTYHRMACAIEDAGFEIRDSIHWTYGSGFPKSLNISKAIDKHFGMERKVVGKGYSGATLNHNGENSRPWYEQNKTDSGRIAYDITEASHPLAQYWEGWGTALKPSHEPIVVARKPISEKTMAENIIKHGTGGININAGRIEGAPHHNYGRTCSGGMYTGKTNTPIITPDQGRFPANTIHDGSDAVNGMFPYTKSGKPCGTRKSGNNIYGDLGTGQELSGYGDEGSAARFFQSCPWDEEDMANIANIILHNQIIYYGKASKEDRGGDINNHPTVKPKALMRYLVKLFTPVGGTILDPFAGSGTTLVGCVLEGFKGVGIELGQDNDNIDIILHRLKRAYNKELERQTSLFS